MNLSSIRLLICLAFIASLSLKVGGEELLKNDWEVRLAMRQIGHDLLTSWGDDSTRVVPIEKEKNSYHIRFEPRLNVEPSGLVSTINEVARKTEFAEEYLVEVLSCDSQKLEYSYYVLLDSLKNDTLISCMKRPLPKACYELKISILNKKPTSGFTLGDQETTTSSSPASFFERNYKVILIFLFSVLISSFWYFKRKKKVKEMNSGLISLGAYQFDPKNMELIYQEKHIELTSKESDLLHYLYTNANETVERENLLKQVWGDDGAYVGRTLDVFVSKLRKKLESNNGIKLVNVRGVGYKLILND